MGIEILYYNNVLYVVVVRAAGEAQFPSLSSAKSGTFRAADPRTLKSSMVCSWPFGCCSRHRSSSRGDMRESTALVRWTLAWQAGQREIIRCSSDLPGAR
jgi:hypothetical protein